MDNDNTTAGFDLSKIDLTQFLPSFISSNPFYYDYYTQLNKVWHEVYEYIEKLSAVRQTVDYDTKESQELWVLIRNANILGYKFLSNFMSQESYLKIVDFIPQFYEVQGTTQTANFLGFVKSAKIELSQLWSKLGPQDYELFEEDNYISNDTVINYPGRDAIGDWYPTSHYYIKYDLIASGGLIDEAVLKELFFSLCPIHYVLNLIIASVEFNNEPLYLDSEGTKEITMPTVVNLDNQQLESNGTGLTFNGQPLTFGVFV